MSGIEAVLGAFGAAAAFSQLAGQWVTLFTAVAEIREKMKNGSTSIQEQDLHIQQYIELAEELQHDSSQRAAAKPFIENILENARLLHETLQTVAVRAGDGKFERARKSVKWKMKERRILDLCRSLEQDKTSLHTSLLFDIHNAHFTTNKVLNKPSLLGTHSNCKNSPLADKISRREMPSMARRHTRGRAFAPSMQQGTNHSSDGRCYCKHCYQSWKKRLRIHVLHYVDWAAQGNFTFTNHIFDTSPTDFLYFVGNQRLPLNARL
jgi:hypothetical protein